VNIHAVIASIGHADETVFPLIDELVAEDVKVTLVDNRGTFNTDELDDQVLYAQVFGGVYQAWNLGIEIALQHDADWCCVLNDDIVLEPYGPHRIAEMLKDRPDVWIAGFDYERHKFEKLREVEGTYRQHGVGGFAFMIRPEVGLRYDTRFNWWGGDDDLVWTCLERGGKAVVVEGVHVQHPDGGNTSGRHYPDLIAGIAADRELLLEKHGKCW